MSNRPAVNDPNSRASRFRRKRFQMIEALLDSLETESGRIRILDLGGRRDYWDLCPDRLVPKLDITIVNLEGEIDVGQRDDDPMQVTYASGDATNLVGYGDNSFDFAHSNSVIEHVGPFSKMLDFANEVRRLAPRYYVQTPYLWFPMEPHFGAPFIHWLPAPTRAGLHMRRKLGHVQKRTDVGAAVSTIDHIQLLNLPLFERFFPDAEIRRERVYGLTKSIIAIR